jgi:hypothetical protein
VRASGRRANGPKDERGRRGTEDSFSGGEELARPAKEAAGIFTAAASAREERMQGVHERRKGLREGSSSTLIAQGRERERRPCQLAINGHGGRPGLDGIQGGGLMWKK